ncbi:hypothetical protein ElyMa_003671800 [Elysia marginata]|uniref:Uncharacterized protein n=1 Tax=Elysia marginata TaxID=1093978 RepID=A0AAV4F0G5_9GAST|nr:hypothetical protein ElyMa_003671800 [Elysia marginata]
MLHGSVAKFCMCLFLLSSLPLQCYQVPTTPRRERQSRPKQRTPRGPKQTPRSARQQMTSGLLSARSIPEEESTSQQEKEQPSGISIEHSKTPSAIIEVAKPEIRPSKDVNQAPERKSPSALATIAGGQPVNSRAKKRQGDEFSKSLDMTSAKQVMAVRKLSDSGVAAHSRSPPSSLLDTGFSGTFDIRAKIEALEKKTNKKMTKTVDDRLETSPQRNNGGDKKASATLVLSPKPVTPPSHRSIQVVSQTPRGSEQTNCSSASVKLSPHRSHPTQRAAVVPSHVTQHARDALWSVKSVSDTDDRLTDIVASNRKVLHSDDTIERFTDFELGSSYDDIFVSESSEKRNPVHHKLSKRSSCPPEFQAVFQVSQKPFESVSQLTDVSRENFSEKRYHDAANNADENNVVRNQPKSILKSKPRDNSATKDSSLPRTKTRATQRERDLRRSTSRGRHGTPSRSPLPDSTTSSSSDTDDSHFIPFTTERDDVLRDPRSVNSKHRAGCSEFTVQKENSHKTKLFSHQENVQRKPDVYSQESDNGTSSRQQKSSPNLDSTSENESLFSGDDVSARNSVSLATSIEHLSSGAENDQLYIAHDEEGDTNDVTLTLADSTEFDEAEGTLEFDLTKTGIGSFSRINHHSNQPVNMLKGQVESASPSVHKTTLTLPQEDDHGDSDTLEPIAASGFYGVKSDIPFSSKKRKINNRKSGQKISQMTSIWSKMPILTHVVSPKSPPDEEGFNKDNDKTQKEVQENIPPKTQIRKTSPGFETPRSFRELADNPIVVVDPPDVVVNSPKPSQERKKSWTAGGTKEKLDELFGKLNSKLKSREGSSGNASPQDEMLGEQKFESGHELYHHEHSDAPEEDRDVEGFYEEYYEQREIGENKNSPEFLAPFDSSIDAIQRSHSQPVLSSRDDMSYYDQSRSIQEYIATDESGKTEKTKSNSSKESGDCKQPRFSDTSQAFWEPSRTPHESINVGENHETYGVQETFLCTETNQFHGKGHGQWARQSEASSSNSEHRGDAMSNDSNRSMINSESDYDAEEVDPLTCAADYGDYRENQHLGEAHYVSEQHAMYTRQGFHQEQFSHSTGFSVNPQMYEADMTRKESIISMASNFSTTSNQGSVSVGRCGNSGRAPPGDEELVERRAHTEEWLVEDIMLKGASPRVGSGDCNSDIPSTASSIADSMSAATAGSVCEIDEEDMCDSYNVVEEEEGIYGEYIDGGEYYDGQGFHCDQTGQFYYPAGEQEFGFSNSNPEDELKLELGFLNNSSEDEEEFYDDEGHGNIGATEFSSDKCVDGSSHHNYTDSSDDYDDYADQNDTLMYKEEYPDDYSDESGEIPGDIIQTMDELGEDILQYLSDEMEEEGEAEEWGEEDPEDGSGGKNINDSCLEQKQGIASNTQSSIDSEALQNGLTESNGLIFYTPNNSSCMNENTFSVRSYENIDAKSRGIVDSCQNFSPSLDSSSNHSHIQGKEYHPKVPISYKDVDGMHSPTPERSCKGFKMSSSSQNFVEVMTDSARLREQFKEHHGHIDDKDIVHVDKMSDGHNLPDNDEFFISFEIDEAHRLSYRQYNDNDGRSPEEAFYEYLQQADGSPGVMSSDQDNVFTQESPLTSLSDSQNKSSLQSNHTVLLTSEDAHNENEENKQKTNSTDEIDSDIGVDFAQKQNLLSEIRTHYQNKYIKKKLVAELKDFDFKSLKHAEAEECPEKSSREGPVLLSPVLPSIVRRLSHEHQDDALKQEFPPPALNVEKMGQIKLENEAKGKNTLPYYSESHGVIQAQDGIYTSHSLTTAPVIVSSNSLVTTIEKENRNSNPAFRETISSSCVEKSKVSTNSFSIKDSKSSVSVVQDDMLAAPDDRGAELNCRSQLPGEQKENHLPTIYTGREENTFHEDREDNSISHNDQFFSVEDASRRRRSSVDSTGSKVNLSKERRRSIRSFWEQLDDEKQKKKEAEETWQRRKSDLKLKQVYRSQSLVTENSQSHQKHGVADSDRSIFTKAMSQDSPSQNVYKKPPPPPVAPKPQKGISSSTSERIPDRGVSVKYMAHLHESENLSEPSDVSQNRRDRRRAQVNHSELAAAIMKRQKDLAQQNLAAAAAAASGDGAKCSGNPKRVDIPFQDPLAVFSNTGEEMGITDNTQGSRTTLEDDTAYESITSLKVLTNESERMPETRPPVAAPPQPQHPPSLKRQDPIQSSIPDTNTMTNVPQAEDQMVGPASFQQKTPINSFNVPIPQSHDLILGSAPLHLKLPAKVFNVPRPSFNAKALAKGSEFLPVFARRSHTDIPTSVSSTGPTQLPCGNATVGNINAPNDEAQRTSSINIADLKPSSNPLLTTNSEPPAPVTKEMKSWVTDYLKDMIGDKHRREAELDSFGSRISSESASVNTSFSANASFYGHLPVQGHHKDSVSTDIHFENSSSPRLLGAPIGQLSISDRINKIQEKLNSSKESIKDTEHLRPTQSQQQFASLLQNRLINVIAQETEEGVESERDRQVQSRKPPPSAWALERQRLFGKGRLTPKSEGWGEPNSTSAPTASEQTKEPNDPSAQLENLSQSLTQSDVVKMNVVRRGRKPRRHTASGAIFDIVEKFNSPDSSSPESWTPLERTRPNSPWVAKAGASPQSPMVSQLVNKLTNTTDSDKSITDRPTGAGNETEASGQTQFNKVPFLSQQLEREVGGVVSGTFDKSIVSELLKKVELSEDESASTSLSNSSSFQAGSLRKHSLEGSKVAELKLKLNAESRSSSNSSLSLSLDPRPHSAGGEKGVRNIVTRLESPFREIANSEAFPRNQINPFSWKPSSVTTSGFGATQDVSGASQQSTGKGQAPPTAPKSKRMYNERRHTTQVNFDELREKYNSMALRREHHTPPQSKALWAVDAASSRFENNMTPMYDSHHKTHQHNLENDTVSFGIAQSSVFRKPVSAGKPAEKPHSSGLSVKNKHDVVDDTLPAELESPLMTSSARQPPDPDLAQFSLRESITCDVRQGSKSLFHEKTGIKELEPDNDTVYSPLSSARVPEAYNLPLDVVPTPDPWVSSDNFREDVSFGELAESESSDTFEFFKKRAEIKEEFLFRQQSEKDQQHENVWQPQGNRHHHHHNQLVEQQQQQHHYRLPEQQQHNHSIIPMFHKTASDMTLPLTRLHNHNENTNSSPAPYPQPQPVRYQFPETIIDTRTATGHVVCRVLSEVPLEPDESGIGGSDNSLGSGSANTQDRGAALSLHVPDRSVLPHNIQTHASMTHHEPKACGSQTIPVLSSVTQSIYQEPAVTMNQQSFHHHSHEDFRRESEIATQKTDLNICQTHGLTSPRRASVHDIHSSLKTPPSSLNCLSVSRNSSNANPARPTNHHHILSPTATATSSIVASSLRSTPAIHSQSPPPRPEISSLDTHFSNSSPAPAATNSAVGERASKVFTEKEKRRRSKSKFMQEIEKKRNASEPNGHCTDSPGEKRKSSRKTNLSASDASSAQLESLGEDILSQSRTIFGPTVARKKSNGALDGIEGEATTNTMQGYSKRFDRLWARFDPNPPRGPFSPEEKTASGRAHESGTSLHGVSSC